MESMGATSRATTTCLFFHMWLSYPKKKGGENAPLE